MDNKYIYDFSDYMLVEGKVTIKRQYTEKYPSKDVSTNAPVREKILSFVKEKKNVTHEELMEFLKSMNEETGGNTTTKWLTKNSRYFAVSEKNGVKTYKLSNLGERVHNAIQQLNKI